MNMKLHRAVLPAVVLIAAVPAPAAAQELYECRTVTITTIEYLSNGARIIDKHSYTVCIPLQ